MVMRPKSIATVVVVFCSTPSRLSSLVPGQLSGSSVRRARISVTAPTRVVLPAPRPPATRILMPTGASSGLRWYASEPPKAIGHLSDVQAEQRQQWDEGQKQDRLTYGPHTPSHGYGLGGSGMEL